MLRLLKEIQVLGRCESQHGLPVADVIAQLEADHGRPSGPVPKLPEWQPFAWPEDDKIVDLGPYWNSIDGK